MVAATSSLAEQVAALPLEERKRALAGVEMQELLYDWPFWRRPEQVAPAGDWVSWLLMTGRGWGKTRTGAEWVRGRVESGEAGWVALIAQTPKDARDVMIEGPSGLLAVSPPDFRPVYEASKARVTWPNGARGTIYSGYDPEGLRGPEFDTAWGDEPAAWKYATEAMDNRMMALRAGDNPQAAFTTTPKPIKALRDLIADSSTVVTRGSSYANRANLTERYYNRVIRRYEGTRLGRQEIEGHLLDDVPGALWKRVWLDRYRVRDHPALRTVVVAVDPAAKGTGQEHDEHGIVVAGVGVDGHGYVLGDLSMRGRPDKWAEQVVMAYRMMKANVVVAEVNNGGDMVEHTIRTADPMVPVRQVHATRGKEMRAEPVSLLYERGLVHHVGTHEELEDQLCTWDPDGTDSSPDRLDALVWALWALMVDGKQRPTAKAR